jgi:FkbM family methyltransferase
MKVNRKNITFAIRHPLAALRYVRMRDCIPECKIARFLPAAPVILEAGAHNGFNTLQMAEFWPSARIYAFEPVPAAFAELMEKTSRYSAQIHCYQVGLGANKGRVPMYVSGDGSSGSCQSSSLLAPAEGHFSEYSFVGFDQTLNVDVVTIDEWASENNVSRIDFIRLDMQGYELEALKGAHNILKNASAVQLEVSHVQLYKGAPLYPKVKTWMFEHGFRPVVKAVFRVGDNVLFVR